MIPNLGGTFSNNILPGLKNAICFEQMNNPFMQVASIVKNNMSRHGQLGRWTGNVVCSVEKINITSGLTASLI
jgi:hypothetical protein